MFRTEKTGSRKAGVPGKQTCSHENTSDTGRTWADSLTGWRGHAGDLWERRTLSNTHLLNTSVKLKLFFFFPRQER